MPSSPPTRCAEAGCNELVPRGYCEAHQRQPWAQRRDGRNGSTRRGRKQRAQLLRAHPVCQCRGCAACSEAGCSSPSTDDDHVRPIREGGARHDPGNRQALCHPCHLDKTKREHAERMARQTGATPWP